MDKNVIIFTKTSDKTVDKVCNWLNAYKIKFERVNTDVQSCQLTLIMDFQFDKKIIVTVDNEPIDLLSFDLIWFNRGFIDIKVFDKKDCESIDKLVREEVLSNLKHDELIVREYLYHKLRLNKRVIGSPLKYNQNKLVALSIARKVGLLTPEYILCEEANALPKETKLLTKLVSDNMADLYSFCNIIIENQFIENIEIPTSFGLSFFQRYVEKKVELRVFYFLGKMVCACIFSQKFNATKLDFRNYSLENRNKYVKYNLPNLLKKQIRALMRELKLDTGSLDIILTPDDEFVFLEVNPVGQVDFISVWANLEIDKLIAKAIVNETKKISS